MSNYFDNERVMYIPLSIDNVDTKRGNYFFSSLKIIQMTVGIIPYFFMLFPLMQGNVRIIPIIIITIGYLFVYSFFLRYVIFEEGRLRKMLRELDNNKVSGIDYFWQNNKIGSKGLDEGIIHYERSGDFTERGLVVTYKRGSLIAVPPSAYTEYRQTKMAFMRELSIHNYDFTWYEIPVKETEVPDSLLHYFNKMTLLDNSVYKQLIKLQLDINVSYTMGEGINYQDFILVRNRNFKTLRRFREIMQDVIDITLANNIYIVEPTILNKEGVEKFFANVLMLTNVDSDSVRKGAYYKPFSSYAQVVRVINAQGADIPLDFIDNMDFSGKANERSIEEIMEKDKRIIDADIVKLNKQRSIALTTLVGQRNRNVITDKVFRTETLKINKKFDNLIEEVSTHNKRADDIIRELRIKERAEKEQERKQDIELAKTKTKIINGSDSDNGIDSTSIGVRINTSKEKAEHINKIKKVRNSKHTAQSNVSDSNLSIEEIMARQQERNKLEQEIIDKEKKYRKQVSKEEIIFEEDNEENLLDIMENSRKEKVINKNKPRHSSIPIDKDDDDISLEDLMNKDS